MNTEVRKSMQVGKEMFWVADNRSDPEEIHGYIQSDGTVGEYFDYATEADAQAAVDLYHAKRESYSNLDIDPTEVKKQYGHPKFYDILKEMADLHSRKNHDYAGMSDPLKNLRACQRLNLEPFMGVMVRLQDKWSRLEEFVKSGQLMVKNESVIDTLMDNAVYSVLAIILYEEQQKSDRTKPVSGGY